MKDIAMLRRMGDTKTWYQVTITLACCSIAGMYFSHDFGAPWGMSLFIGVFFMLPLAGLKLLRHTIDMALEAYDGNQTVGGQARWVEDTTESDTAQWSVEVDLGAHGTWMLELGGERPVPAAKKDLPATVTVWLHPDTKEPRLVKTELGLFLAKKIRTSPPA